MIIQPLLPTLLPGVLYAETHYRFKYFFTLLSRPEPEIIVDAPHRLDPESALPVVILAKDAHLYPARLRNVVATLTQDGQVKRTIPLTTAPITLEERWWWSIFSVDVSDIIGTFTCDVSFDVETKRGVLSYRNDNHRTSTHAPMSIIRSGDSLPSLPESLSGELHAHSSYTDDQVEFGLPLAATKTLSRALGLSFAGITDHSYDLDDSEHSYLLNDPALPKWIAFQREAAVLNAEGTRPAILRGEEVTIRNSDGKNVHCLVYGDEQFHPGSGDSAERWLRTRSELDLPGLLERVGPEALVIGAHIDDPVPMLQRYLLGRGAWTDLDLANERLDGIQFWNGQRDGAFESGKRRWIRALASGRALVAIAGNDAHGNFNRFRQIHIPFLSIRDADHQLFGRVRTTVFCVDDSERAILAAIRGGRCVMTDGPLCCLYGANGDPLFGRRLDRAQPFSLRACSSAEFGSLSRVLILEGRRGESEKVVLDHTVSGDVFESGMMTPDPGAAYYRAEVYSLVSSGDHREHACLTNPFWL